MNIRFDIPKNYNDMSLGEVAQLSVKVKKLVDELNRILSNLDEKNLSPTSKTKLKELYTSIDEIRDAIEERTPTFLQTSVDINGGKIQSEKIHPTSIITLYPEDAKTFIEKGVYVYKKEEGQCIIKNTANWNKTMKFTVMIQEVI